MEVFWTTFATVISGTIIFALSEWIKEIWFFPLHEYKELKVKVSYALTKYGNKFYNPSTNSDDEKNSVSRELRDIASEIDSFIERRNKYQPGVPTREELFKAARGMTGLSNGIYDTNEQWLEWVMRRTDDIKSGLRLFHHG